MSDQTADHHGVKLALDRPEVLASLPARCEARVVGVSAHGDDAARLMALGVCVGRRLQVVKSGDPMIVRVVGARVGLSARLAAAVLVERPLPPAAPTKVNGSL